MVDVIMVREKDGTATVNIPQRKVYHSPDGFDWGYAGSGPADLSLNILLEFGMDEHEADRLHQKFKAYFIQNIPYKGGVLAHEIIHNWIKRNELITR